MLRLAPFLLLGCAQSKPIWHEATKELCHPSGCYRVGKLDSSWQPVREEAGAIGFYNDQLGGVIEANATCSREELSQVSLGTLTRRLLMGYSERRIDRQERVSLSGGQALRTHAAARLDGVPIELELVVLTQRGCVFDLSYVAQEERFVRGEPDFERFIAGFVDEGRR
jgi:hypothetical protein